MRWTPGRFVAAALTGLAALGAGAAAARADGKMAAEAAFVEGRDLMSVKRYAEACAAFERSLAIDPQLGTEYNLALCDERLGRTATAWGHFREVAERDSNEERRGDSAARAAHLQPLLTFLEIDVDAATASPGQRVTADGADVTALANIKSPIDPGPHEVRVTAPGRLTWHMRVQAGQPGAIVHVPVPALAVPGAVPATTAAVTTATTATTATPGSSLDAVHARAAAPARPGGTYRAMFWTSLAVTGAAAIGTGLGVVATGATHDRQELDIRTWQQANPGKDSLSGVDPCTPAQALAQQGDTLAGAVANDCATGDHRALVTNVLLGTALVAAVASGVFYYEGYVAAPRATIVPIASTTEAGAMLRVDF